MACRFKAELRQIGITVPDRRAAVRGTSRDLVAWMNSEVGYMPVALPSFDSFLALSGEPYVYPSMFEPTESTEALPC